MKKRTKSLMHNLHLYLGLAATIVLMIVGVTGALLSYEKELLRIFNPSSFEVKVQEKKLPMEQLVTKFLQQKPDAQIRMITISSEADESYMFRIASPESRKGEKVYIDPYTAELLPQLSGEKFFRIVENLHRRLMLGEFGKQLVGASTIILIILVISGIYIYMPRIKRGFLASFTFKTKTKGKAFLYSMHGAVGMWVIPFYLVVSLTGLYWSYQWYNSALYALAGVEKPQRHMHKKPQKKEQQSTVAKEKTATTSAQDAKRGAQKTQVRPSDKFANSIATAFESFHIFVGHCYADATLFTEAKDGVYRFMYVDKDPAHIYARNSLEVRPETMQLIKHERYDDKTAGGQLMGSIFALHSGEYFGWIGQLGMFLASLLMPLFGITGLMLYLKKRKSKK